MLVIGSFLSPKLSATEWPNAWLSDCALDPTNLNCSTYTEEFKIELPGYAGCPVWIMAEVRECDDPAGGPLPIIEFHITRIYFDTPNDVNDPNDPCFTLHQAYINAIGGGLAGKINFVRNLMEEGIEAVAVAEFNKRYTQDSIAYLIDPNSAEGQRYLARKCENGQQHFRSIQGSCTQAFIWDDCDYPSSRVGGGDEKRKEVFAAYDPTYTIRPCRYVRYEPCSEDGPCCIETLKICKEPSIFVGGGEVTTITKTTEIVGESPVTCEELPGHTPLPGETTTGCYTSCDGEAPQSIQIPAQSSSSRTQSRGEREVLDAKE